MEIQITIKIPETSDSRQISVSDGANISVTQNADTLNPPTDDLGPPPISDDYVEEAIDDGIEPPSLAELGLDTGSLAEQDLFPPPITDLRVEEEDGTHALANLPPELVEISSNVPEDVSPPAIEEIEQTLALAETAPSQKGQRKAGSSKKR